MQSSEVHQKIFADRKDNLEKENQNILHTFGAQLHHSLKDLNKIIVNSLSEQEQQLICIEECTSRYLSTKFEVRCALQLENGNSSVSEESDPITVFMCTSQMRPLKQRLRNCQRRIPSEPWK